MSRRAPGGGGPAPAAPRARLVALAAVQGLAISGLSTLVPAYLARAGAGDFLIGLSLTAWALTRGGLGLLAGRAYGRWGARRLLTLALAIFAASTLGYALSTTLQALVALRLAQGVAAGLYWTALFAAAAAAEPPERRLGALSRINVTAATAGLASNLLAGVVAAAWSPRAFFWAETALLLVVGLPLAASVPFGPAPPPALGARAWVGAAPPGATARDTRRRWQVVLAATQSLALVVTGVGAPVLLSRAGGGYRLVGGVGSGMVLAGIAAQALAVRLARRAGSPRLLALAGTVAAAALAGLALLPGPTGTAVLCVLLAGALSLCTLTWLSFVQAEAQAAELGRLTGLLRGVSDLAAMVAYTAFGLIAAHLVPALLLLSGLTAAGGLLALALPRAGMA